MASSPKIDPILEKSINTLFIKESRFDELSFELTNEKDRAYTVDKTVKISKNMWDSLSLDGKYYLLCHEVGHYLKGHNRSSSNLSKIAIASLILIPFTASGVMVVAPVLALFASVGTMVLYNGQYVMTREYQADICGYKILEQIDAGAYLRGMKDTNIFHINRDMDTLHGKALAKSLEMRKNHLALKEANLEAISKIA